MANFVILFIFVFHLSWGFRLNPGIKRIFIKRNSPKLKCEPLDSKEFDGANFDKVFKIAQPFREAINAKEKSSEDSIITAIRKDQEQLFRSYPFSENMLPILPNCNNYYSGKFNDNFWHQNDDQVYVYIPLDNSVDRSDITVKFTANQAKLFLRNVLHLNFTTPEKITPDASFWLLETDRNNTKYVQLDLEKRLAIYYIVKCRCYEVCICYTSRYRMINWKSVFADAEPDQVLSDDEKKQQLLQKIFAANQGLSKATGESFEGIEEMSKNKQFMDMISQDVVDKPTIVGTHLQNGDVNKDWGQDKDACDLQGMIESGQFGGLVGNGDDGGVVQECSIDDIKDKEDTGDSENEEEGDEDTSDESDGAMNSNDMLKLLQQYERERTELTAKNKAKNINNNNKLVKELVVTGDDGICSESTVAETNTTPENGLERFTGLNEMNDFTSDGQEDDEEMNDVMDFDLFAKQFLGDDETKEETIIDTTAESQ